MDVALYTETNRVKTSNSKALCFIFVTVFEGKVNDLSRNMYATTPTDMHCMQLPFRSRRVAINYCRRECVSRELDNRPTRADGDLKRAV